MLKIGHNDHNKCYKRGHNTRDADVDGTIRLLANVKSHGKSYPSHNRRLRFFQEVPEPAASPNAPSSSSVFILDERLPQRLGLAFDIVIDTVSPFCVPILTTRLNKQFIYTPVVQVHRNNVLSVWTW